jgi:pimeloyl-ACP methyl ester carboxylesterase
VTVLPSSHGVQIQLDELGGDGPPILFAHATGFCADIWGPVARHLADFRCFALDFRAHGRSTRPDDDDLSWDGTADDVMVCADEILDRTGEPLIGVGHSMGGAALLLAEQARPGTFRGLWLFEPIVISPGSPGGEETGNSLSASAARRRATFDSLAAARENFASKPPMNVFDPAALTAYIDGGFEELDDGTARLRCRPEDESRFYELGGRHGASAHLAEVTPPVWVARGRDEPGPALFAPPVAEGVRDGRLIEMPTVGHFGPMQDPAAIAASIRELIETLEA